MKVHYNIWVKGIVQGVFFRKIVKEKGVELGLFGFVRNLPDGRVYVEAEGDDEVMQEFIKWMKTSPGTSLVEDIRTVEHQLRNYTAFITK